MKGFTHSMKNFKFLLLLMALTLLFTACAANTPAPAASADPSAAPATDAAQATVAPQEVTPAVTPAQEATAVPEATPATGAAEMSQKVKDFILNGQNDLPEADKLHWTEAFLNLVDMESQYNAYLTSGGKADDVEGFAKYITDNAPVPENWKELFEAEFAKSYGEKIVKYEAISDNYYQVYVSIDGSDVPYVAVDARTGWYHG